MVVEEFGKEVFLVIFVKVVFKECCDMVGVVGVVVSVVIVEVVGFGVWFFIVLVNGVIDIVCININVEDVCVVEGVLVLVDVLVIIVEVEVKFFVEEGLIK